VVTKEHLISAGLPTDKAQALAAAGAGLSWLQWLQFIAGILQGLGGVIGKLPNPPGA